MESQIQQAVEIALSGTADPNLKNQAYDFINHVKSTEEGYQSCVEILANADASINEGLKFFIFQVIEENMARLSSDQLALLNTRLFEHLNQVVSRQNINEAAYLKNKLAGLFGRLFCHVYVSINPAFLKDLLALAHASTVGLDHYTRILLAIHAEIGDKFISRTREVQDRNNVLKDAIRSNDMSQLVESWQNILQSGIANATDDILNNTLKAIGAYVGWMEINLFVSNTYLNTVFQFLKIHGQRIQTCLTLIEIISKKMKGSNKLELINLLNLTDVINSVKDDEIEFIENLAKLANQVGLELTIVLENEPALLEAVNQQFLKLWPIVLDFLGHEYDDVSQQVFPFIQQYLLLCKKFTQIVSLDLFSTLLNKIVLKMKFDEDDDGLDVDQDFAEVRQKLKTFQDTIAVISPSMYTELLPLIIEQMLFSKLEQGGPNLWISVELGLYQLNNYGESLKVNLINVPKQEIYTSKPFQVFSGFFTRLVDSASKLLQIPHPKVQSQYFELIVRHYTSKIMSDVLTLKILDLFTSQFGLFNSEESVRLRCWYLFFRFIKLTKPSIDGQTLETLLIKLQPLLVIEAELPTKDDDDEIVENGNFNNQLYLFETIGCLITIINNAELTLKLIDLLFQPLFKNLETCIGRDDKAVNAIIPLQAHHLLMALATIVRGFETDTTPELVAKINNASQCVLVTLENFNKFENVREAARFSFSRFLPILGNDSHTHLSKLISLILAAANLRINELGDFLSFVGQIIHQFRNNDNVYQLLNDLLGPLINKVYATLSINDEYPDLIRDKYNLKKAFMNLVSVIVINNQSSLLITETNKQNFPRILTSFVDYAYDLGEPTTLKLAIVQLVNVINIIGGNNGKINDQNDKFGETLPPIEGIDEFLMDAVVKLSFELPFSKQEFDLKDAQFRNMAQELATLLKTYQQRLGEFLNYLVAYLTNMGLSQQALNDLGTKLVKLDQRGFKKYFITFLTELKKGA